MANCSTGRDSRERPLPTIAAIGIASIGQQRTTRRVQLKVLAHTDTVLDFIARIFVELDS